MRRTLLLFLFATALVGSERSTAQTFLRASQFGSGSARLTGANHILFGTLGQPIAGFSDALRSGFWYVAGPVTIVTGVEDDANTSLPDRVQLRQNYPNPFNPSTTIAYELPKLSTVRIEIFDGLGRLVRELVHAEQAAGTYSVVWDGRNTGGRLVSTGLYIYRLVTPSSSRTRAMLLMK